jgi:acetoin utilization deacetylase AcuC-like enzyme
LPRIYEYAKLSAGSSVEAMKMALKGKISFSLMRPPGHHAGINGKALGAPSLGFCYFNNVAIATKKALNFVDRVAIVDIDCHFGNGTQQIFFGDSNVLYVSLHKFHPGFYPGGGRISEENCFNYPLPPGTTEKQYFMTLEKALKEVRRFDPELIAVSAGFDTHKDDPLTGGLGLEAKSFRSIGLQFADLKKPSFAVLEGGYGATLPECVYEFLIGYSNFNIPRRT